jgi:predicted HTH domain antitoxin
VLKARDFVEARLYKSEEDVIQDALRHLLRARPELRIQLAIHRYQTEKLSLAKAASMAGVSWAQMKDILLERGVQPRLGPETLEEAAALMEAADLVLTIGSSLQVYPAAGLPVIVQVFSTAATWKVCISPSSSRIETYSPGTKA